MLVILSVALNLRGFRWRTIRLPRVVSWSRTFAVSPGWRLAVAEANPIIVCLVAGAAESGPRLRMPARTKIPTRLVHRVPVDGFN